MYSITRRETFENITNWLVELRDIRRARGDTGHVPIMLVGNKKDLNFLRTVSTVEAEDFARALIPNLEIEEIPKFFFQ